MKQKHLYLKFNLKIFLKKMLLVIILFEIIIIPVKLKSKNFVEFVKRLSQNYKVKHILVLK